MFFRRKSTVVAPQPATTKPRFRCYWEDGDSDRDKRAAATRTSL
jgi:hypothetical protein